MTFAKSLSWWLRIFIIILQRLSNERRCFLIILASFGERGEELERRSSLLDELAAGKILGRVIQ